MKPPLMPIDEDPKWDLLSSILSILDSRPAKQKAAKSGLKSLESIPILKIVLTSMYFSSDIAYIVSELNEKKELRKFLNIGVVPTDDEIYRFMSKFEPEQFIDFTFSLLNNICSQASRKGIIVDSTDIVPCVIG